MTTLPLLHIRLRALLRLAKTALHLIGGALIVLLVYPGSTDARRLMLKQRWSQQLLDALGVTLKVGAGTTAICAPNGMLVANHVSFLDVFVINALAPAAFVAKDDVRKWPLIGWMSTRTDTIFIERGSRRAAQLTRENLVGHLRDGKRVVVFPEGTTSDGRQVLPFHGALLQSAIDAGVAVTPLALRYTDVTGAQSAAADYIGDTSLAACLWAIACADGLAACIETLPALPTTATDRRHLAAHAHRAVSHALKHALSPSPKALPAADRVGALPDGLPAAPR
ncbi:MAG: hypothetical protein A3H93_15120 [Rhodocyclales bacterium RIFCSPLOWO2_02_FULL_63_24]|nr:MAG: hypothetical protein A3H93_15120 [Rhodocyclales bacterium RIFCSPLOWO2_02_FULL_63_24]